MTEPLRDGAITVTFLDAASSPALVTELEETADVADEFLAHYLVTMICDTGMPGALITIARESGRPTAADRLLWELIEPLADDAGARVVDLVVTGGERTWSMRSAAAA